MIDIESVGVIWPALITSGSDTGATGVTGRGE
jgi:hypothetical protein